MATASISGLGSGLDTASIIEQFMQLEAASQTRLKTRQSAEKSVLSALQSLNTKVAALATRAGDLLKPAAFNAVTATTSEPKVAVSATTSAAPGSYSIRVDQTAVSHRSEHVTAVGTSAAGTVPTTVRLDRLDGTVPLDLTTDGTLGGLVAAINDPANATGLRATAVRVGTDQYRLVVESAATGAAGDFTLTDAADGSALLGGATVRQGRDAQVTVGDSIVATSSTNTFADLVPGVTVTLAPGATTGTTSEVVLARDPAATTTAVKGLVDAVNSLIADIDAQTKTSSTARGVLAGDAGVRSVRDSVLSSVFPGDGTSLADLGIQTDRFGKVVLDEAAFKKAYDADPTAVQSRLTASGTGFVARIKAAADGASDSVTGTLTTAITGSNATIARLDDGIEAWDLRLELRRTALTRQFTALETALNQMNSQSTWLSSQISSLPTGS
ncbi:flagellar hook-associated protein 2 [Nocardioides sp. BE266]|uniref:flagellar filament capping protein FliD n=1 Tax=Nocardioides sp. BE266 TaxID=2817725 RepID=UPI002857C9AC|nr:flagellar filament capping protein FliD [Nocardioides sp. BE266]MDR7252846.1 flagellar hook-associated protein 2 [Nocardioides sp. BE266]